MRSFILSLAALSMLAACSGSNAILVGSDAGSDGGGCVTPTEMASCTPNEVACQPPGDVCCVGYSWSCVEGVWTKLGVGCACQAADDGGAFSCGPSTTCTAASDYCVDQAPGIALADGGVPPDSYACTALPPACANEPTCACLKENGACAPTSVASCDESHGQVTVHCLGE